MMPDEYPQIRVVSLETAEVLAEIEQERLRQDEKWGEQNHLPSQWMVVLGEEFGEVCRAILECKAVEKDGWMVGDGTEYRKELIQVAAVAVAAIESLDRQMGRKG